MTPEFPFAKRGDARGAAVDIVRGLVKLLAETTADGYVFRVDLRLRPDAGRHPGGDLHRMRRWIITKAWARTGSAPP